MGKRKPPGSKARPPKNRSEIMRSVASRDTQPEVAFRKAIWARGLRYRVCAEELRGKPDISIPSARVAVFIDGDFWHGGQWKRRKLAALDSQFEATPSREYWLRKIRGNMLRDCSVTSGLLQDGWTVLRFWESQLRKDLGGCVEMTQRVVREAEPQDHYGILPQKTVAEFFAGIGLMRMGLEKEGWRVVFANDIDPDKLEMYGAHFPDAPEHYLLGDIHQIPVEKVPQVTLATASFPCNDLSLAGARAGLRGKQSSAFWGFVRILRELGERRPPIVLLENVTGFLTSHGGEDFHTALKALNDLGYAVDAFILDAARFVPQSRQRLFVVGLLEDQADSAKAPHGGFYESDVRPQALAQFIFTRPDIRWRLRDLPPQPKPSHSLEEILEELPADSPHWWSHERAAYLLSQMSARHREIAERMIHGAQWSYGAVFRRVRAGKSMAELRVDGLAGCLRTPRGGSGRQILFKAGKGEFFARLLTPRECARLMGAGDYLIDVPLNQALFGFGDAVCVPVIQWIATYYLNPVVNEMMRGRPLHLYKCEEEGQYDPARPGVARP